MMNCKNFFLFVFISVLFVVDLLAMKKDGDVLVIDNVSKCTLTLCSADVRLVENTEIGNKSIDFLDVPADNEIRLLNIYPNESRGLLLILSPSYLCGKKLLTIKNGIDVLLSLEKLTGGEQLAVVDAVFGVVFGFYRHTSGSYHLIISDDCRMLFERADQVLTEYPGIPSQWTAL